MCLVISIYVGSLRDLPLYVFKKILLEYSWFTTLCICCIANWFSYTYTYIHSFPDSFLIEVITECWVEFPVLYSWSLLVIYLIYRSCCYCCCCWSVAKQCPTLRDLMDYSLPGFSIHGIFQARILEWVAVSFPRGSAGPKDQTQVCCIGRKPITSEPPGKPKLCSYRNAFIF